MSEFNFNHEFKGVWAEKYRPDSISETILPNRLKRQFQKYIDDGSIPNLLLISPSPGTGKTTIAKIIIKELNACELGLNGSQDNGIDIVRGPITRFVRNDSMTGSKIVFIDEADGLTLKAQQSLKSFIEDNIERVRFIMTANDEYEFIDAIMSRFQKIHFNIDNDEYQEMVNLFTNRVLNILKKESIKHDPKAVFQTVKNSFPDYREVWQNLESTYNSYGEITKGNTVSKKAILKMIEAINTKDLSKIRSAMTTTKNINYNNIYSKLLEHVDSFDGYSMDNILFTIADWNYKNKFVADKFLNFLGMCADMIQHSD